MRLVRAEIINYKCFRDSGPITFEEGINVIVGQNDAGKSALIEALTLRGPSMPHRSITTIPHRNGTPPSVTTINVVVRLGPQEIVTALAPQSSILVPSPGGAGKPDDDTVYRDFTQRLGMGSDFSITHRPNVDTRGAFIGMELDSDRKIVVGNKQYQQGFLPGREGIAMGGQSFGTPLAGAVQHSIYHFEPERIKLGTARMGITAVLRPDASNLAQVLNNLQTSNPPAWERFLRYVRSVFPHIRQVTAHPHSDTEVIIEIWHTDPNLERPDLAVPLSQSGTGIGQVLAMLYVVVNSIDGQTILIDEPHSFLHPSAVRKLFAIFREHSAHQYIVTTHSPTAILSATPATLTIVKRDDTEHQSKLYAISTARKDDLAMFLDEVGARLSDVFGPDRILWVEGKTEETVVPLLLRAYAPDHTMGLDILGIPHTGDFDGRHVAKLIGIYRRLSRGASILPRAVGFVLDRETRSQQQLTALETIGEGLLHFLPRRMFENYFVIPPLLAAVLAELDSDHRGIHTEESVRDWLVRRGGDDTFFKSADQSVAWAGDEWNVRVDGAKILGTMFSELSETRVGYDKVRDGTSIVQQAIEAGEPGLRSFVVDWLVPTVFQSDQAA